MASYLVVEGNSVYEVDQDCAKQKQNGFSPRSMRSQELDQLSNYKNSSKKSSKGRSKKKK